jgi:CHAT domain-containing protein
LLVIGNPAFGEMPIRADRATSDPASTVREESCEDLASTVFAPLAGTMTEVEDVAELSANDEGATLRLTGVEASEEAFKRNAPGKRVLHLATHGFFVAGRCPSALDPTGSSWRPEARGEIAGAGDNPLLLCGLALAGANGRAARGKSEDGMLTAYEVASIDLAGVEWVVLSACETALGDVRAGEGVLGLRRAFQTAGAATIVVSLWRVDDLSTLEWMRGLYASRLAGLSTAEAVRRASVAMITARRGEGRTTHPHAWGAFVAAGDWR